MNIKKKQKINAFLSSAAREVSFLKDIIQQAPDAAKKHAWTIDLTFANIRRNLERADALVMKGIHL